MNAQTDLDRLLTAWLASDAPVREPDPLLDRVLARTARTRRRAAWRIPERWFPVSTITTRVEGVSRFPWRTAAAVALLVLALAVGAWVIAGSRAKAVPAPFGPAHNGVLTYSVNGDIVVVDSPTGTPRTVIDGTTFDSGPLFSSDGTRIVFVRGVMDSADAELWTADPDGTHQRRLAATPHIGWAEWSPLGDVVAVSLDQNQSVIRMVRTDGSGSTDIPTGLLVAQNPIFRPSDGLQMTFRGKAADGTWGLYVIGRDGSNMQRLDLDPGFANDPDYTSADNRDYYFLGPAWSPDGTKLMYHTLEPDPESPAGPGFRIHIAGVSATGAVTGERTLEFDRAADDEFDAAWLPTGDGILFQSIEGTENREWVADLSAGSAARDLGVSGTDYISYLLSPDGRQVIVSVPTATEGQTSHTEIDLATLKATPLTNTGDDIVWQRTAQ